MAVKISEDLANAEHQRVQGCYVLVTGAQVPEREKGTSKRLLCEAWGKKELS